MSNFKEHWIKNPWLVGFFLLFLTTPITALWDVIVGLPYLTTLKNIWKWFLTCDLKLWWIILYIIVNSTIKAIWTEIKNNKQRKSTPSIPRTYLRFTAVKYGNYRWKWEWGQDELTKDIYIQNLSAVCPNDSCKNNTLFLSRTETKKVHGMTTSIPFYICSICSKEYILDAGEHMVKPYIFGKINDDSFIETTDKLPTFVKL